MSTTAIPAASSVLLERCESCSRLSALPRGFCATCGSRQVSPHAQSGRGVIWSHTCVHPSASSAQAPASPYWIALVRLECGVKIMVRIPAQLAIGDCVDIERVAVDRMATFVNAHRPG